MNEPAPRDPVASVVIPCRDEAGSIEACVASLMNGAGEGVELLVVDGGSTDGTREILARLAAASPAVRVLDNPVRTTPAALNLGVRAARGAMIVLAGAHTRYPPGYVAQLVAWLQRSGADGVGGVCRTVPGAPGAIPAAIAAALASRFGVGDSRFRIGAAEPRWVETVPFGGYRREIFDRCGLFDEDLVRNQDDEFNYRVRRRGGRLLLVPSVVSEYRARASLRQAGRMFYQYGLYKPLVAWKVGRVMTLRQLVPAALVLALVLGTALAPFWGTGRQGLAVVAGLYGLATVVSALAVGRSGGLRVIAALAIVFPTLHLSYGAGFLRGALRLLPGFRSGAWTRRPIPLSR